VARMRITSDPLALCSCMRIDQFIAPTHPVRREVYG